MLVRLWINGLNGSHSGGIRILENEKIIRMLKKSIGKIKCVVYDDYSSVYRFRINANGFTAAYNRMKEKWSNTIKLDVEDLDHLEKAILRFENSNRRRRLRDQ